MPRILYLVTEDWFFLADSLPMARAARAAGFDIHIATHCEAHRAALEQEGFTVHPMQPWRRSLSPIAALRTVLEIQRIVERVEPAVIHQLAVMPVMLGSVAALGGAAVHRINHLTGLGYLFVSEKVLPRLIRPGIRLAFRYLLNRPHNVTVFQNDDDRRELIASGLVDSANTFLIRGSGVDIAHFGELPDPPNPPFTIAYVGRMLADKGVPTLVEAMRRLRGNDPPVRLILAGMPDEKNPSCLRLADLREWAREPDIEWWGHIDDVRTVWTEAHVAVLPSRREGLPKCLMEAASCGRALLASDVPGCREVVKHGVNGLLVPPDDPAAIAAAVRTLATDRPRRLDMAARSRSVVEGELCAHTVTARIGELYRSCIGTGGGAAHAA